MNSLPQECPVGKRKKRRKTPKKNLEAQVVRKCLRLLAEHPDVVYAERRNTGMVLFQGGGCVKFGHKGAADIWCLLNVYQYDHNCRHGFSNGYPQCHPEDWGSQCDNCKQLIHIEIECKRADGKGKQTPAQQNFEIFCHGRNIPYLLVTSAKELAEKLLQFGP